LARGFDDLSEAARVETCSADERAVDVRLAHEFAGKLIAESPRCAARAIRFAPRGQPVVPTRWMAQPFLVLLHESACLAALERGCPALPSPAIFSSEQFPNFT
jgi:hypothetical protein